MGGARIAREAVAEDDREWSKACPEDAAEAAGAAADQYQTATVPASD